MTMLTMTLRTLIHTWLRQEQLPVYIYGTVYAREGIASIIYRSRSGHFSIAHVFDDRICLLFYPDDHYMNTLYPEDPQCFDKLRAHINLQLSRNI